MWLVKMRPRDLRIIARDKSEIHIGLHEAICQIWEYFKGMNQILHDRK